MVTPESSRRSFLRLGATVGALGSASLSGCVGIFLGAGYYQNKKAMEQRGQTRIGASIDLSSQKGRIKKRKADTTVKSESALKKALKQKGTTIWVAEGTTIDMTSGENLIAPNVTLASNRGISGGNGGLIKCDDYLGNVFEAEGPIRVTGLRFKGPQMNYLDVSSEQANNVYHASAFQFSGKTAVVDNCEFWAWTSNAMSLGTTGDSPEERDSTQGWIHHNSIHHTQIATLGYSVELFDGFHLIEWNHMADFRHAITAYGYKTNAYEARCNYVGPPGEDSHAFAYDMHRLGEQDGYDNSIMVAGKYVNAHHNVFDVKEHNSLSLSGFPTKYARFANNWVLADDKETAVDGEERNGKQADLRVTDNKYGEKAIKNGREWLDQHRNIPLSDGKPSLSKWTPPKSTD